jgi:hypothetical protein
VRKGLLIAVGLLLFGGLVAYFSFETNTSTERNRSTQFSWTETKFEGEGVNWVGSYTVTPRESPELGFHDMLKLTYKKSDQPRGDITVKLRLGKGNEIVKKGPYTKNGIEVPGGGSYDPIVHKDDKLQLTVEWDEQIENIVLKAQ